MCVWGGGGGGGEACQVALNIRVGRREYYFHAKWHNSKLQLAN